MKLFNLVALLPVCFAQYNCENSDSGFTDNSGDDCTWYQDNRDSCGLYDAGSFVASEMCCGCGGGWYAACEDMYGVDWADGTCQNWYNDNPHSCGTFDDNNFRASSLCCACGGGNYPIDENSGIATCWDTADTLTDSAGDGCSWYSANPESCGMYDSAEFGAQAYCCACDGGVNQWGAGYTCDALNSFCVDMVPYGATDSGGWSCQWYELNSQYCGMYDTYDFSSYDCCACGGGGTTCNDSLYTSMADPEFVYSAKTVPEEMTDEEAAAVATVLGGALMVWLMFACFPCIVFWTVVTTILVSCGVCCKCCCCYGCCNPKKKEAKKEQ